MKKEFFLVATALPLLIGSYSARANGSLTGEQQCAPEGKLLKLASLFAEGGSCANLPVDFQQSIRAEDPAAALDNFQRVKHTWLDSYDLSLGVLIGKAFHTAFWSVQEKADVDQGTLDLASELDRVTQAIDAIRPDQGPNRKIGGTTYEHLDELGAALKALPAGYSADPDAGRLLGAAIAAVGDFRSILSCRSANDELTRLARGVPTSCNTTGMALPLPAQAYKNFFNPLTLQPSSGSVAPVAVSSAGANAPPVSKGQGAPLQAPAAPAVPVLPAGPAAPASP